jgi:hypothetical protein
MSFQSDIERGFAPSSSPAGRGWGNGASSYQNNMGGDHQDEYAYELAQVSQNIKTMTFNFNQIMDQDRFIGTERDTQEFRDKLYALLAGYMTWDMHFLATIGETNFT